MESYAVGDVRALVPARKAVWSLPGKAKGHWENFLPSTLFMLYPYIILPHLRCCYMLISIFFSLIILYLIYCFMILLSNFTLFYFHPSCVTTRSQPVELKSNRDGSTYRCRCRLTRRPTGTYEPLHEILCFCICEGRCAVPRC